MKPTDNLVVVVGSANVDLVVATSRIPRAGETVLGGELKYSPGGKGANQACAAAKAGGCRTAMIGALGTDSLAGISRKSMEDCGVDVSGLQTVEGPNGTALITVDSNGENAIVVAPGANARLEVGHQQKEIIRQASVLLGQMEIPLPELIVAAKARSRGIPFILNAAPSQPLPYGLWRETDVLVVNEHEARDLVSILRSAEEADRIHRDGVENLARVLLTRVASVIVTLGSAGAMYFEQDSAPVYEPALPARTIDTVGAGDTFCGALAARVAKGETITDAVKFASAASALAVEKVGAQEAIPTYDEVVSKLESVRKK
ncbi:ribokinase [Actinomycetaceae bacterium MB13-C1-2]|nr:ribokinase [Actinomycetaceae bacterium MB13-C1-2]